MFVTCHLVLYPQPPQCLEEIPKVFNSAYFAMMVQVACCFLHGHFCVSLEAELKGQKVSAEGGCLDLKAILSFCR